MPRSKFATRLTLVVLSALTLAACSSEVPDTHPDQPVTKRKQNEVNSGSWQPQVQPAPKEDQENPYNEGEASDTYDDGET